MKKYVIAIVILIMAGLLGWKMYSAKPMLQKEVSIAGTATTTIESTTASGTGAKLSDVAAEKDRAWAVLQNYLEFAKNKNIAGVASLSYQLSPSCKAAATSTSAKNDCLTKIASVYGIGSQFKEKDFTTVWYDSKQIILSTEWQHFDGQGITGLVHSVIYFVKDSSSIKLLSFNPSKGVFINVTASSTQAQNDADLAKKTKDSDQDGISDYDENCTDQGPNCIKTDPNKRDTNGNGYWDGIEALFYKK